MDFDRRDFLETKTKESVSERRGQKYKILSHDG